MDRPKTRPEINVPKPGRVHGLCDGSLLDASGARHGFERVQVTGSESDASVAAVCQILDLDIGPIHRNVLGLVIDLDEIHLDITAVTGTGNLLGNLLCALVRLLD